MDESNVDASPPTMGDTPQTNGGTADVEMNGTHETKVEKEDAKDKDMKEDKEPKKENEGAKDQDQTEEELNKIFTARREEEMARRDRSLAELLVMLDGYKPLVRPLIPLLTRFVYTETDHVDTRGSDGILSPEVRFRM